MFPKYDRLPLYVNCRLTPIDVSCERSLYHVAGPTPLQPATHLVTVEKNGQETRLSFTSRIIAHVCLSSDPWQQVCDKSLVSYHSASLSSALSTPPHAPPLLKPIFWLSHFGWADLWRLSTVCSPCHPPSQSFWTITWSSSISAKTVCLVFQHRTDWSCRCHAQPARWSSTTVHSVCRSRSDASRP